MGAYKIKYNKKLILSTKEILVILISIFLFLPGLSYSAFSLNNFNDQKIIGKISKEIEIPIDSDYFIKFSKDNLTLEEENISSLSSGLSEKIKDAIAKSPKWIQQKLTMQFQAIKDERYADLILETGKKYVDEIAFSIACSYIGNPPPIDIIRINVLTLYENDEWIKYADIVDYDDGYGNFYSTIKYRVIENGTLKEFEHPPEIYYWYVVHPQLTGENADYVYGEFWRNYLFNHNDIGYPLLKEKLSNIYYLWDCKSYYQEQYRTWNWSIANHPTAIEVISYWVGKTVTEEALGDRPGQPNIIAHEHNGWCGELQKIAVAAQRTALIPSVGIYDLGEDHVWREFYERGWHENDNWWADTGGAVDQPDIYAYGWGKDMSALLAKNSDGSVYEVTPTYIHPEDRNNISFKVLDRFLNPVDGARIVVTVWGPKDITYLKSKIFEIAEKIFISFLWLKKIKIFQMLYEKVKERISRTPDFVDGPIYCIWNYTDMNGDCLFELGKNRSYIFIVQYGNLKKPLYPAKFNTVRVLQNPRDKQFFILDPFIKPIKNRHKNIEMQNGDVFFNLSFNTKSYQVQNILSQNPKKIVYERDGKIDFFIVDEENFEKYNQGLSYNCYNYLSNSSSNISVSAPQNTYYFIFRNNGRTSNIILNYTVTAEMQITDEKIQIVKPETNIFDEPIINIGEKIIFSGIATNSITLYINNEPHEISIQDYEWGYEWETIGLSPGNYSIEAECGNAKDHLQIKLIDKIPPILKITSPKDKEIIESEVKEILGQCFDNQAVQAIELSIDNGEYQLANGTNYWSIDWDITNFSLGFHNISAKAFDVSGCVSYDNITIVLNESGHSWAPIVNTFFHSPITPTNTSNVIVFANVTTNSPFTIQKVILYLEDGIKSESMEMFRYGDYPIQARHEEDPLINESNDPLYGLELGQFSTDKNIIYWIKAIDSANNSVVSNFKFFKVT